MSSMPLIMRANIKWCRRTREPEVAAENYICSEFILVITSFSAGGTTFERTNFLREFFLSSTYTHIYAILISPVGVLKQFLIWL